MDLCSVPAQPSNGAWSLFRDAIGGEDVHTVSQNLTIELEGQWTDDGRYHDCNSTV